MAPLEWEAKRPMFGGFPVLIVSGEAEHRNNLARATSKCGLQPVCCGTFVAAELLIARQQLCIVLCDDLLPDGDFRAVMGETARCKAKLPVTSPFPPIRARLIKGSRTHSGQARVPITLPGNYAICRSQRIQVLK